MKPENYDLDLGDGHWLEWTSYEGERCGGIITHTKSPELLSKQIALADATDAVSPFCRAALTIKDSKWNQKYPGTAWEFSGTFESPTFSPSFLCHCGDHGFIREGIWVRA